MRIVLFGNFVVDYCSEVHHARSLEKLGHTVIRLQETEISTDVVLRESLKSDALIWIHSHGFQHKGKMPMWHILDLLRHNKVKTLAYHLDLYMGLARWKEYEQSEYFNKIQYFFTVDKLMADWLNDNTETKAYYIPAGVLEDECYTLPREYKNDVIFVGSKGYHPEWPYRPQLINWLSETYGNKFSHFGGDGLGVMRGASLNELYSKSKVVIGDTLCPGFDYPYYFSDRVFETIGRGGFIIHPYIKGIEECFSEDELVTYKYNDFVGLKKLIDYYLEHEEERQAMAMRGFKRVITDHTYTNRWETIINILNNYEYTS